jgi:uncharacterized protein (DUF58 family)
LKVELNYQRSLPLLFILLLFGVLFHVPLMVALSLMLLVVFGLAFFWKTHSLDGVVYQRKPHYRRGFPGEQVPMRLEVENQKLLPLSWFRVQDPWPKAVGPDNEDLIAPSHIPDQGLLTNVFSLRWYEKARRFYTLIFRKRGIYAIGPAHLESGDLFGMFELSKVQPSSEYLTVFPSLIPFRDLQLPAEDPFGDRRSRRRLYEDLNQPIGLRDYHPEDSIRRVHWPMTAHTGQLQVKVYQPSSANVLVICLNVATYSRHWEGTNPLLLEHVIRVSATLAYEGIGNGYRVGLIANGCLAHSDQPFRIPPGRSPRQLATLLEALAGVTPVVTSPYERFLIKEVPKLPYGASLLIVTSVCSPELAEALVQLHHHGRRITLLSFEEKPPPEIPGVRIVHLPFKEQVE